MKPMTKSNYDIHIYEFSVDSYDCPVRTREFTLIVYVAW